MEMKSFILQLLFTIHISFCRKVMLVFDLL